MKLTRKKAIELCIELWEWLALTGKKKTDWPKWEEYGGALNHCWFCEYNRMKFISPTKRTYRNNCKYCPYNTKFAYKENYSCESAKSPFFKWGQADYVNDTEGRRKYAKLFLAQIRTLEK